MTYHCCLDTIRFKQRYVINTYTNVVNFVIDTIYHSIDGSPLILWTCYLPGFPLKLRQLKHQLILLEKLYSISDAE